MSFSLSSSNRSKRARWRARRSKRASRSSGKPGASFASDPAPPCTQTKKNRIASPPAAAQKLEEFEARKQFLSLLAGELSNQDILCLANVAGLKVSGQGPASGI